MGFASGRGAVVMMARRRVPRTICIDIIISIVVVRVITILTISG
jgi:hypothetical protein